MNSCGADTPVREMLAARTNRNRGDDLRQEITRPFALLMATLREIFDESAYARFLHREKMASSPVAYANFLRETEATRARLPKCC